VEPQAGSRLERSIHDYRPIPSERRRGRFVRNPCGSSPVWMQCHYRFSLSRPAIPAA
jgi:hypothetical protein